MRLLMVGLAAICFSEGAAQACDKAMHVEELDRSVVEKMLIQARKFLDKGDYGDASRLANEVLILLSNP
jgi:hypothetical protein